MENKTHYRKIFKSDHLGSADLEEFIEEDKPLVFTISHVKQEHQTRVAGKKIDANIAYFKDKIKPLVLNATNSKKMKTITGSPFIEDWKDVEVELFIDKSVKMKGEIVGGVRIKTGNCNANKMTKPKAIELIKKAKDRNELVKMWQTLGAFQQDQEVIEVSKEKQQSFKTD